jgi:hypothetical protein
MNPDLQPWSREYKYGQNINRTYSSFKFKEIYNVFYVRRCQLISYRALASHNLHSSFVEYHHVNVDFLYVQKI